MTKDTRCHLTLSATLNTLRSMSENTLRERKKKKTREALSQAALELFVKQGFEATTVEQIAERLEVSRRTFFRYFATKEEVVFPYYRQRLDSFREWLQPLPGEDGYACVSRACLLVAREYMLNREELLWQQRVVEASSSLWTFELRLDRTWETSIAEALEHNPVSPLTHAKAVIMAGAIMGAIRATLRQWFDEEASADLVAMGRETLELLARSWNVQPLEIEQYV